jgi:hypothetical protein
VSECWRRSTLRSGVIAGAVISAWCQALLCRGERHRLLLEHEVKFQQTYANRRGAVATDTVPFKREA